MADWFDRYSAKINTVNIGFKLILTMSNLFFLHLFLFQFLSFVSFTAYTTQADEVCDRSTLNKQQRVKRLFTCSKINACPKKDFRCGVASAEGFCKIEKSHAIDASIKLEWWIGKCGKKEQRTSRSLVNQL